MNDINRKVRVAAAQYSPVFDSATSTVKKVLNVVKDAAMQGAELVVFPESFIPYYPYFSVVKPPARIEADQLKLYEYAVVIPGPVTDLLAAAAKEYGIVVAVGVTERDNGTLYNTQLIFDKTGEMILKHRKILPAFHEKLIWGMGDGTSINVIESSIGRLGALTCWEHYSPLARFMLMTQHEEIHISTYIGSLFGPVFQDQTEVQLRNHALEGGCFVVNATAWLQPEQVASITDNPEMQKVLDGGCMTAIIGPNGKHIAEPLTEGEGLLIADLDFELIIKRKRIMDVVGHYSRPDIFSLINGSQPLPQVIGNVGSIGDMEEHEDGC